MAASNTSARHFVPIANKYDRVVLLVDMDCFYCQVEEKLNPSLKNQPLAVVQYNAWKGGGIIAVNYAARAKGVTRHMRGDEAKEHCPDLQLVKVPNVREKADLTKYREAGKDVANVLQRFTPLLERASVDEAYLDITDAVNRRLQEMNDGTFILRPQELENTYAVGFKTIGDFVATITTSFVTNPLAEDNFFLHCNEDKFSTVRQSNIRLLIGASIASEIRSSVKTETLYDCSAGIAHNKILAKLACGINKPNKQTILPLGQISVLFETLPIGKIKGLGAKFGEEVCERLNVRYIGQLLKFTEAELQKKFDEKNGTWLYNICRGIDLEAVTPRFYSKSIGSCKKFPGRNNITGLKTLQHWLNELANEIIERLEKDICENNRRAKQMVINFIQEFNGEEVSSSRSAPLPCYDTEILAKTSLDIIKANTKQFFRVGSESVLNNPIKFLGISVGKFETISNSQNNIQEMFAQQAAKKKKIENDFKNETQSPTVTATCVESETIRGSKTAIETVNTLKQMANEKQPINIKSFFCNALRKEHNDGNQKPFSNNVIVTSKNNFAKLESNANNQINVKTISSDEKPTSSYDSCNPTYKHIQQNSFFAKVLNKKEEPEKKEEGSGFKLLTTNTSNENNNPGSNESVLTDLSININIPVYNEENKNNLLEVQNESETESSVSGLNNVQLNIKRKYDKISHIEVPNRTDYRSQYAEFAIPQLTPDILQFIICSKCGAKVFNDPSSIQTHDDHHFAQELSKQQRHAFRDEFRSKINSTKSPPNIATNKKCSKTKSLNASLSRTSNSDIKKFLKSTSSSTLISTLSCSQTQVSETSTSDTEICEICKLPIKMEQILEHKDFHIAKQLQRKLNQLEVKTIEVMKKTEPDLSKKSINLSKKTSSRQSKTTAKSITQFFNQSNT